MIRQRNKTADKPSEGTKKTVKKSPQGGSSILSLLVTLVIIALATSYVATDTFTFGFKLPSFGQVYRKVVPGEERVFTVEELAQYDGSDPDKPIYLALLGKVYDVTAGRNYYGPGGGYSFFAGRDATRSYITGCFQTHLTHDLRGLSEGEIKNLDQWVSMYANSEKYFYVGTVCFRV